MDIWTVWYGVWGMGLWFGGGNFQYWLELYGKCAVVVINRDLGW